MIAIIFRIATNSKTHKFYPLTSLISNCSPLKPPLNYDITYNTAKIRHLDRSFETRSFVSISYTELSRFRRTVRFETRTRIDRATAQQLAKKKKKKNIYPFPDVVDLTILKAYKNLLVFLMFVKITNVQLKVQGTSIWSHSFYEIRAEKSEKHLPFRIERHRGPRCSSILAFNRPYSGVDLWRSKISYTRNVVDPSLSIMCRRTRRALRRFDLHWIFPGCQLYFNPMPRRKNLRPTRNAHTFVHCSLSNKFVVGVVAIRRKKRI